MVFPVVMYRCESWTIKKAECWRVDAFELWCWRRLLRVPWTARRSNQSILKEIGPECSLEGLMLKLKLQYFGHLMRRADSFEKTLILGKIEGRRRRGWQRMTWLDGSTNAMDTSLGKPRVVMDREAWHAVIHGVAKSRTWLSNWTELKDISNTSTYIHLPRLPDLSFRLNSILFRVSVGHKCLFVCPPGYYGDGLNAIIVFAACFLPDSSRADYHYVMENLFLWVMLTVKCFELMSVGMHWQIEHL